MDLKLPQFLKNESVEEPKWLSKIWVSLVGWVFLKIRSACYPTESDREVWTPFPNSKISTLNGIFRLFEKPADEKDADVVLAKGYKMYTF